MLSLKVPLKDAQKEKLSLRKKKLIDTDHIMLQKTGFLFIPVKKRFQSKFTFSEKKLEKVEKRVTLKELVGKEIEKTAYDIIGSIAVVEVDVAADELKLATALLKTNKTVKTVVKKASNHEG